MPRRALHDLRLRVPVRRITSHMASRKSQNVASR